MDKFSVLQMSMYTCRITYNNLRDAVQKSVQSGSCVRIPTHNMAKNQVLPKIRSAVYASPWFPYGVFIGPFPNRVDSGISRFVKYKNDVLRYEVYKRRTDPKYVYKPTGYWLTYDGFDRSVLVGIFDAMTSYVYPYVRKITEPTTEERIFSTPDPFVSYISPNTDAATGNKPNLTTVSSANLNKTRCLPDPPTPCAKQSLLKAASTARRTNSPIDITSDEEQHQEVETKRKTVQSKEHSSGSRNVNGNVQQVYDNTAATAANNDGQNHVVHEINDSTICILSDSDDDDVMKMDNTSSSALLQSVWIVPNLKEVGYLTGCVGPNGVIRMIVPKLEQPAEFVNIIALSVFLNNYLKAIMTYTPTTHVVSWKLEIDASAIKDMKHLDNNILNGNHILTPVGVFDMKNRLKIYQQLLRLPMETRKLAVSYINDLGNDNLGTLLL